MEKIEKNKKKKSQKNIFLNYLNYICSKIKDKTNTEIYKYIKDSSTRILNSLFLFNTPIEFENEELI